MRKLILATALAPMGLMLIAAAPLQDVIEQMTVKATDMLKGKGMSRTGFVSDGKLASGAQKRVSATLPAGSLVLGICDGDCTDLNLYLIDANGQEVDNDTKDDDLPILAVPDKGSYTINVEMKACGSSGCRYRLLGFSK